jgi:hypothetical protein
LVEDGWTVGGGRVLGKLLEGGRQSEIVFRLLSCFRLYLLGSDELFSLSPPFLPLDDRLAWGCDDALLVFWLLLPATHLT